MAALLVMSEGDLKAVVAADSNGCNALGSKGAADDLSDAWSIPNDGIDVFLVRNISDPDLAGISPTAG